ncbi:hypothetical protein [Campylobacter fetus]|uniref:hypothetical protein n=1 Tax=Campylobacter fetus TaxID=196 RepID=UPI000FCC0A66|nr:hypothetical protein [Campylobacter fetus]RUT50966.1 hypothetical protein BWK67_00135 [Campylobacter fetus]RUT51694.1 hypothetical protein BWK51_00135 [Campylobacter fetus]
MIIEQSNKRNVGVQLWKDEWLQEITTQSGELAVKNEYQVHYWALILRKVFDDSSILDISIPICIYNYHQVVSAATIDFEGADLSDISDKTKDLASFKASELTSKIPDKYLDLGFKPLMVSKMTLHRHP